MASFTYSADDQFAEFLSSLETDADEIAKKAIFEGTAIIADEIKAAIDTIPSDNFRFLRNGDQYSSTTDREKGDLKEAFGITPIDGDAYRGWNAKVGFDGYGSIPTKRYPKGVPNQLVARAIESGSIVRIKFPFVRKSVNRKRKAAVKAMNDSILKDIKEI